MASNRQSVPKFGEWTEDVPFTLVFDKASRSSRKNTNKSNPNEYPDMNLNAAQTRNQRHDQPPNRNVRPRQETFGRREETEFRQSPAHNERNNRVRAPPPTAETYNNQSYGGRGRNPSETNRRQPYDPTPVKTKPISNLRGRGNERVATIPPFPGSASENENYTFIFEKVKENKRQSETVRSYDGTDHSTPTQPINDDQLHQPPLPSSPKPKGCCFPRWGRK